MHPVLHVPAFKDNYIWLIRGQAPDKVAIVDPGDAAPVLKALADQRLTPVAILCTHHHGDHVGGVRDIVQRHPLPVFGPAAERIPGVDRPLREGDRAAVPELEIEFEVLDIPAHTAGHIAFYGAGKVFCGDTLFSAGCGRLFEGSAAQMTRSLAKLARLPDDTEVYCGHEYTAANLRFALAVDPGNKDAAAHLATVQAWRDAGRPSLPSTIGLEKRINPFLRAGTPAVRAAAERRAGRPLGTDTEVFAEIRAWKDGF